VEHDTLYSLLDNFFFPSTRGEVVPLRPSPAGLNIYSSREGVPLPLSSELRAPHPLCYMSFFFSCLFIIQLFFLFSLGGVNLSKGLYDLSMGVPHDAYLLTWWSPKQVRSWHLVAQELSWSLHLTWSGDGMHSLGVWRCRSFASSWWFFLPGVSPVSLQEFALGSTLSASSL
jgi:hypothetical protein